MVKKLLYILVFLYSTLLCAIDIPANIEAQYNYLTARNASIENSIEGTKKPWYIILKDGNLSDLKALINDIDVNYERLRIKSGLLAIDEAQAITINDYLTTINAKNLLELYVALEDGSPIVVPITLASGKYTEEDLKDYYQKFLDSTPTASAEGYDAQVIKQQIESRFQHDNSLLTNYENKLSSEKSYKILLVESLSLLKNKADVKWKVSSLLSYTNKGKNPIDKEALTEILKVDNKTYHADNSINKLLKYSTNFYKLVYGELPNGEAIVNEISIKKPFESTICDYLPEHSTVDEYGVKEAIKKLNTAHGKRNAITDIETPRSKGSFYHLVNVSEGDLSGKAEIIEDKLYLLKQKTGVDFYVVFQPVATKMNLQAREEFAKQVLEGSDLKGSGSTVLITVPFLDISPTASLKTISCIQPGFVQSSPSLVSSQSFKETTDLFDYVLGAFTAMEKPVYLVRYFESVTGELVKLEYKSTSNLRGQPYINAVRYYRSKYAIERETIEKTLSLWMMKEDVEANSTSVIDFQNQIKQKVNEGTIAENEIGYNIENSIWQQEKAIVSQNVGLFREPYISNPDLVNQFIEKSSKQWAYGVKFDIIFNNGVLSKEHFYNIDNFSIVDPVIYGLIDVAGLIPGIDNFADPIGMLYAGYRNNAENVMAYSFASAITGAGALYFKAGGDVFGVVAKLDDADNLSYVVRSINGEVAEDELQLTSSYVRQRNVAEEAVAQIEKQGNDIYYKELILAKRGGKNSQLSNTGKFIDDVLENDYQKYLTRKVREGKSPKERLDWKEARDYWLYDSPLARGNAFNEKAKFDYEINELNLKLNGKNVRVDSYVPSTNGTDGKIISRKATDLADIQESTFRKYLKELKDKYPSGTLIRSDKYPALDGKTIQGKQYLEIPDSNKSFPDIDKYTRIAKNEYNIEIIFLKE
ncbi:hypothetical protein [Galbibacter pacificus]|uniref:Uncharacterized protein n=1 Tax=Galbibacter pacificus TaxID=2996052 RepID=A0ABT6FWP1_9FLAO|nr:hypothetical protein [Galbibacter pacificus]MDG3584207.1 hypothetical protein [Galbibacter pacificus]MDG3587683.1 hypothetical protein [Galbibacter pacificus]